MRILAILLCAVAMAGCQFLPKPGAKPSVFNPYPELSRVAVAPFFNLSTEPTVDGRQFALQYYTALQAVPGYEVVPIGVVEQAITDLRLNMASGRDAQRLAEALGVDAVVIGAVTDFTPYYPPRCGLRVEWYSANPCLHPIPPGYGLPWGRPEEEQIPESLVFEAEMAKARAEMKKSGGPSLAQRDDPRRSSGQVRLLSAQQPESPEKPASLSQPELIRPGELSGASDMQALVPAVDCDACQPTSEPVLRHTRNFSGNDPDFTGALKNYAFVTDDARFGGWQGHLQRSDDFIRFCCHLHIAEMLAARGGSGQTRVVWRWPADR